MRVGQVQSYALVCHQWPRSGVENDFIEAELKWMKIGENYNPALGFVPRAGIRVTSITWPVQEGYGVYLRRLRSSRYNLVEYVDLTPYVQWEGAGHRLQHQIREGWRAVAF